MPTTSYEAPRPGLLWDALAALSALDAATDPSTRLGAAIRPAVAMIAQELATSRQHDKR